MPESVTGTEAVAFEQELRSRSPALLRFTLLMGTLAFAGMALVDPQLISGPDLELALWSRLVTCVAFIAGILLTWVGDWAERWARPASIIACALTGLEVILLSYLTGGSSSSYHEALHVTMFGYAILPFPWRRFDGALTFTFLIAAYCALLVLGDRVENVTDMFSKVALIGVSAMVAGTFERVIMNRQLGDFRSRTALAAANERLKTLDIAKNRFFSNISHELRTPLTLIVAPLEALIESTREPLSAGQRERLLLAQRNALRLLRLVDDLLSLTKAEAASLKLHVSEVELGRFVADFTHDVSELAARKHITVDLRTPEHPVFAEVDPTLIERVLLNVFGNAAKFVDLGGHIEVTVEEAEGGVEIAVRDNGIGISEAHLPRIFDRFYQAESGSTRTSGGTGIGLSLVKEIAELHGGRVSAQSKVGEGTRVACWFPLRLPAHVEDRVVRSETGTAESGLPEWHQAIRAAKSYRFQGIDDVTERRVAPRPSARGDAPTVLVVEDNPDMIRFLVALLAYDYNVLTAQNGKDGLKMALERGPDLIISDVMMPEMDGFEMVRRLREDVHGARIPLIFLTARGSSEDRIQGHSGGADTYLAKPFRSEELLAAVDALITRQKNVLDSASSREDEALVFMASGIHERLAATMGELRALQSSLVGRGPSGAEPTTDSLPQLAASLANLAELLGALRGLAQAGAQPVTKPVDLDDAVRGLLAELEDTTRAGKALHLELGAREVVRLDEDEVRAIVDPLLRRALRVTPIGRNVYLTTARRRSDDGRTRAATLTLRDEGPALSPDQLERLFFPFASDEDPREGLELAHARRLVLARGGNITMEPVGELGNSLVITLPVLASYVQEVAA